MTIHAVDKNMRVTNVIIDYRDRPEEANLSSIPIQTVLKVLKTIFKFYKNYKPLAFFSIIGLVLFAIEYAFSCLFWLHILIQARFHSVVYCQRVLRACRPSIYFCWAYA